MNSVQNSTFKFLPTSLVLVRLTTYLLKGMHMVFLTISVLELLWEIIFFSFSFCKEGIKTTVLCRVLSRKSHYSDEKGGLWSQTSLLQFWFCHLTSYQSLPSILELCMPQCPPHLFSDLCFAIENSVISLFLCLVICLLLFWHLLSFYFHYLWYCTISLW